MSDWTEKYRPRTLDQVLGNPTAVNTMRSWAKQWEKGIPQYRAMVLMGSPGIGKTTSALALANEMGWDVVEMNASDQRNSKEIEQIALRGSRFNTFGDDGSYMSVSQGKRKLIILDEADNFFGNADKGAIPAINNLIKTTLQPVILIVNDFYELKRKSAAVKDLTLQITFKRTTASTMSKALYKIAEAEGVEVEPEAMEIIAANAAGDMRAAVRNLQSLAQGMDVVTLEMAQGLSQRDSRKDMYDLMTAIFRKTDPSEARRIMFDVDVEPKEVELWVDENMPYEYLDRGDLIRGYEALCRADIYLSRVMRRQYFGFWSYAGDMMTMGVANARMTDRFSRDRIRFPMYLSRMSKSKSMRALKKAVVYKIAVACHTSTKRASMDVLPYLRSIAANDPSFRVPLIEMLDLEPAEMAFMIDIKADSAAMKKLYKEVEERAETHRKAAIASKPAQPRPTPDLLEKALERAVEKEEKPAEKAPEPVVQKEEAPKPEKKTRKKASASSEEKASEDKSKKPKEEQPKPSGQRSLFDF
ncbi:MAG: replication factor C large subunit [Candidatus Methanomethylophilaceae archaeon]|nr:replication factor C large subunit [Candidatus Methanomethylophilaceae archaeon]MBR6871577.1 replication factor C large subunit [Candidatus Methanomethylophilaceae archaeon]